MRIVRVEESRAGFTLIEVLVAFAVLGLLVGLTATVLHVASFNLNVVSRSDAQSESRNTVISTLRRLMMQARPDFSAPEGSKRSGFIGSATSMEFLGSLSERYDADDIVLYRLYKDSIGALHVSWRLDRSIEQTNVGFDYAVPGSSQVSFSYYGMDLNRESKRWLDDWNDKAFLPIESRLRFDLNGQSTEILAALSIGRER